VATRNKLTTVFVLAFAVMTGSALHLAAQDDAVSDPSPRIVNIVNIVNFVRQNEPRIDWITEDVLYETVVSQIEVMKEHQLRGTFLLQYDALMDTRYQELFKELPPDMFEIGAWWEIPQPLVENSGYEWRGRYPWDWHADVGFATGYTPEERVRLVDTYMADFKAVFGDYPKSVGSWFIDAHTLKHMSDRYGIIASCNCKDQIGTDGYTLWGGYWNQGYYPSVNNAYMPAQNAENQIPVPIFRMLGSDPIHQYDNGLGTGWQRVVSLEPVYPHAGGDPDWCRWYFDAFVEGEAMAYGFVQAGQENSFTWDRMGKAFELQMAMIERLLEKDKATVQTLGETGQWFKDAHPVTPPTSVTVLDDHSEKDQKTVWFNSRFYRANLLWDQGTMRFRDIHLFDERVASDYLTQRGDSTQCCYDTLPFVDGFRWSSLETVAGLRLKSQGEEVQGGVPTVDDGEEGKLTVRWPTESPEGSIIITLDERAMRIRTEGPLADDWYLELSSDEQADLPLEEVDDQNISCLFKGTSYAVKAEQGTFIREADGVLRILPDDCCIALDLSER
jgi:hypothetical protein